MTKEEAKDLIAMIEVKEPNELIVNSWWGSFVKDYKEALQMAIQSLEAWEKVKEEIKQKSDYTKNIWDEYPDEWYAGKCSAYHESLRIIEKYLSEVSE